LASRYGWLAAPFLIGLYLAVGRWGSAYASRFVQTGLLLLTAVVFLGNFQEGHAYAETRLRQNKKVLAQVRASSEPEEVSAEVGGYLYPVRDVLLENLRIMQEAKIGPYRHPSRMVDSDARKKSSVVNER
jgi:hypothetical protein